jgi:putative transposase
VKRQWIDAGHRELSIRRQCELLELERSSYYYQPAEETAENLSLMRAIDEEYTRHPFYGSRRLADELGVNRKRVQRLMRSMGLEAVGPKPRTTRRAKEHKIYPYLLRNVEITRPDQVWSTDITYIPLGRGYLYLTAVLDWYSRYVLAWRLSPTLEGTFCLEALDEALGISRPEIFNTDQGSQFTSTAFTSRLEERGIAISMDGRGRALDNAFIERLWRTVKYEEVYLQEYEDGQDALASLKRYWRFYNRARPHQSLAYRTPAAVYFGEAVSRERRPRRFTARV